EDRVAEVAAGRPLLVADLADQLGLDPDHLAARRARHGRARAAGVVEAAADLGHLLAVEAGPHRSRVRPAAPLPDSEMETAEAVAPGRLEAEDGQVGRAVHPELQPVGRVAGAVRRIRPLG